MHATVTFIKQTAVTLQWTESSASNLPKITAVPQTCCIQLNSTVMWYLVVNKYKYGIKTAGEQQDIPEPKKK